MNKALILLSFLLTWACGAEKNPNHIGPIADPETLLQRGAPAKGYGTTIVLKPIFEKEVVLGGKKHLVALHFPQHVFSTILEFKKSIQLGFLFLDSEKIGRLYSAEQGTGRALKIFATTPDRRSKLPVRFDLTLNDDSEWVLSNEDIHPSLVEKLPGLKEPVGSNLKDISVVLA